MIETYSKYEILHQVIVRCHNITSTAVHVIADEIVTIGESYGSEMIFYDETQGDWCEVAFEFTDQPAQDQLADLHNRIERLAPGLHVEVTYKKWHIGAIETRLLDQSMVETV